MPLVAMQLLSPRSSSGLSRGSSVPQMPNRDCWPHSDATAGRRGDARAGVVGGRERIEHLEEIDERRDQHALGETLAAQLHHQRVEHERFRFRLGHETRECAGLIDDVGVGEEEIFRRAIVRFLEALLHRPELAGPAGEEWLAGQLTQFEMRAVEAIGLVKMDLLGNRAISTIGEPATIMTGAKSLIAS